MTADAEPIADRNVHLNRPPAEGSMMCHFRTPQRDWIASRLDCVSGWPLDGRVLDAGCGPGEYVPALRERVGRGVVVGLDLGFERVTAAVERGAVGVRGDVEALPFGDSCFDAAIAMHMLYHVPDIAGALAELRRVVRDGGAVVVSTNSAHDEPEVTALYADAGGAHQQPFGDRRFCMENADDYLGGAFSNVERHVEESTLDVPAVEPVVNSFASQRYMLESTLSPGVHWSEFLDNVRERATELIEREGAFTVSCRTAIYVCR